MSILELLQQSPLQNIPLRLQQQIGFLLEMDKLKKIMRRSPLLDKSRTENDAEHSWHLALCAVVLSEYAKPAVNLNRVIRMLLIHDVVEIDAGDTFLYEESSFSDAKSDRELSAANRLYGLLPADAGSELLALWKEFEERKTPDAVFASALDRIQPLLLNYFTGGGTWLQFGISAKQVIARKKFIKEASEQLWVFAESLIKDAVQRGFLKE